MRRVCVGLALALVLTAAPQSKFDRDASARDYVRFLVLQLEQWRQEFPQQFYAAAMRPPVDASKLSETAKSSAADLGSAIQRLSALASANDILTGDTFHGQLDKTLAAAREVNQAMAAQRFPALLYTDWEQIRTTLNDLARVYKVESLAVVEPPGGGGRGGRGARTQAVATGPTPGGGVAGYIVDLACAKRGKGMWTNAECIARCIRDGDKIVLVTDDNKIYQISNQDKITPESYGQVVTLTGKIEGDTIKVDAVKM